MTCLRLALLLALLLALAGSAHAERLALKTYTIADGLAHNHVYFIVQDSHGFMWFCTRSGLSRFDGYRFTTYSTEHGLSNPSINYLLESRRGIYWIATNGGGVCRFDPTASRASASGGISPRFTVYPVGDSLPTNRVNGLYEDRAGRIWASTDAGLFRLDDIDNPRGFSRIDLGSSVGIYETLEDRHGVLLVAAGADGLYRLWPDGRVERYTTFPESVVSMTQDREGRVWVATRKGLCLLVDDPQPDQPVIARTFTTADGLPHNNVTSLYQSADGRIWVSTMGGLAKFDGQRLHSITKAQGLSEDRLRRVMEDSDGNLWLATPEAGVMKLIRNGFTAYDQTDSTGLVAITSLFESQAGEVYVASNDGYINRSDKQGFTAIRPAIAEIALPYWMGQAAFLDHAGQWWMLTLNGLCHFPKVTHIEDLRHTRPLAIYTARDGLPGNRAYRIFEDSRGDLWLGATAVRNGLTRWERASGTFHQCTEADGLPTFNAAFSFCEDRAGNVWIGYYDGGLVRYRDGRFTRLTVADGWPKGMITGLYLDHSGRLWITSSQAGLVRVDDPAAEPSNRTTYSVADGLATVDTRCVTEDQWGRIYIGTARGVDRLEPDTGRIKHYTTADGLSNDFVISAFCDHRNQLWFGTMEGVSRLIPKPDQPQPPPPVLIGGLRVAGVTQQISELGETEIRGLEFAANQNQVEVDFFGLSFGSGGALRYQYLLEGLNQEWSAPADQRTITYASLSPGAYRLVVRAINTDGVMSAAPASVAFRILPPIWRRWWFMTIAAGLLATAIIAFARYRAARISALRDSEERFRTLAETASDAIITIDEQSRIVFVNPAAETVFGYSQQEMLGADLVMLMPETLRHLHRAGFERYNETRHRHIGWESVEMPGLHKDGREIPLELSFGEFIKGDKRYFTGIARDITERKRAEAERQQAETALQQSREERLRELERVRRRIATDLHDDIGSSLTRISLLSEVMQRQVAGGQAPVKEPLSLVARLSREVVDSMSDIVWAINPNKDHLRDLSQRMRHFASDLLTARSIAFRFRAPDSERDVKVGANFRRELFLIFKEAVNNMVRHSGCSEADIEFRATAEGLTLQLHDNGRGFDVAGKSTGHGLASMRERIEALSGELTIVSTPGEGTTLTFAIPLQGQTPPPNE
jgi:PAS domain S-box-containing protein